MKRNKLFENLNDIDEKIIEEASEFKGFKKRKSFNPMEFLVPLVAATLIMIIVLPTLFNRDTLPGGYNEGLSSSKPDTNKRQAYNELVIEPDYENAQYRSNIGTLFYETGEKIGFSTSFGIFIYNIKTEKLETAFKIDSKEAFREDYTYYAPRIKDDEKSIYISAFSEGVAFSDYYYEYSLKDDNLYKIDGLVEEEELYPMPEEKRRMEAFSTKNWTAKDLIYNPIGLDKNVYPFKDVDIKNDKWSYKYNIEVDGNLIVDDKDIEINKSDFEIILLENINSSLKELNEEESLGAEYLNHLKIIDIEPADIARTDGTIVTAFIYKFEDVAHGTNFKLELSDELKEKIGIKDNIINISIKSNKSSKKSKNKALTQIENQEFIVKEETLNEDTIISFGKAFINLYNGAVSKGEVVSFENYITNKNLLKFADEMLELTKKQELKGGTGVNYGLENDFKQAKIVNLEEEVYYLELPFEYEGSGMTCKMIITSEDKTLKLVDFYFGNKDGVDTFATGHIAKRKIKDPTLWDNKDWVNGVFDKLKELEKELNN